jgi:hypothetical protein
MFATFEDVGSLYILSEMPWQKNEPGLRYEWYEQLLASLWGWEFAWFATSRTERMMNKG